MGFGEEMVHTDAVHLSVLLSSILSFDWHYIPYRYFPPSSTPALNHVYQRLPLQVPKVGHQDGPGLCYMPCSGHSSL